MRPSANRHKTTTNNAPRANAGDSSVHEHAGQLGSTTHNWKGASKLTIPGASPRTHQGANRDSGSRRPEARHRDSEADIE